MIFPTLTGGENMTLNTQRMNYPTVFLKATTLIICLALLVTLFAGCKQSSVTNPTYIDNESEYILSSQTVASNSSLTLKWDAQANCVLLVDNITGKVWSDINYDLFNEGSTSGNANSSIKINVADPVMLSWTTYDIYNSFDEGGSIDCERIKNGVKVTYYFKDAGVSIPVNYVLNDNSLKISVKGSEIRENADNGQLVSISIAPFMCSASNTDGSYLFVPSGMGAIMNTLVNTDGTRNWSGEVYGSDKARRIAEYYSDTEEVRLPVFGAKDGDDAILAVIDNNAETAFINAESGNERMGRSNAFAEFYLRGYDVYRYGSGAFGNSVFTRTSKSLFQGEISISYYPLSGEDANISGMSKLYQKLINIDSKKSAADFTEYSLNILGGTKVSKSVLGIPFNQLVALTTFNEAGEIISSAIEETGISPVVKLMNFGDGGMEPATISGGKNYAKVYGGNKQYKNLMKLAKKSKVHLFTDFDIVRFSKSGMGVSTNGDSAKTPTRYNATQYKQDPIRNFSKDFAYNLIGRNLFEKMIDKVISKAKKTDTEAVSFATLTSYTYSDYSNKDYYSKANFSKQVSNLLNKVKKEGLKVGATAANDYSAVLSDVVFNAPSSTGDYDSLDFAVPFYQMVFGETTPLYSTPLNTAANFERHLMYSAMSGMGISYEVIENIDINSNDLSTEKLYSLSFDDNIDELKTILLSRGYSDFYNSIAGVGIKSYDIIDNKVSRTVFKNGITVYANHSAFKTESPIGVIDGYGYLIEGKE